MIVAADRVSRTMRDCEPEQVRGFPRGGVLERERLAVDETQCRGGAIVEREVRKACLQRREPTQTNRCRVRIEDSRGIRLRDCARFGGYLGGTQSRTSKDIGIIEIDKFPIVLAIDLDQREWQICADKHPSREQAGSAKLRQSLGDR
jgi:hypothetical protein